jgi:hypothetical protein
LIDSCACQAEEQLVASKTLCGLAKGFGARTLSAAAGVRIAGAVLFICLLRDK